MRFFTSSSTRSEFGRIERKQCFSYKPMYVFCSSTGDGLGIKLNIVRETCPTGSIISESANGQKTDAMLFVNHWLNGVRKRYHSDIAMKLRYPFTASFSDFTWPQAQVGKTAHKGTKRERRHSRVFHPKHKTFYKATGWLAALIRVTNLKLWFLRLRDTMLVFVGFAKRCLQYGHSFRLAGV